MSDMSSERRVCSGRTELLTLFLISPPGAGRALACRSRNLGRSIRENDGLKHGLLWIYMIKYACSTAPHVQAEAPVSPERGAFPPRARSGSATPRPGTTCVRGGQRSSRSGARPARRTGRGGTGSCRGCFRSIVGRERGCQPRETEVFRLRLKVRVRGNWAGDRADEIDPMGQGVLKGERKRTQVRKATTAGLECFGCPAS